MVLSSLKHSARWDCAKVEEIKQHEKITTSWTPAETVASNKFQLRLLAVENLNFSTPTTAL